MLVYWQWAAAALWFLPAAHQIGFYRNGKDCRGTALRVPWKFWIPAGFGLRIDFQQQCAASDAGYRFGDLEADGKVPAFAAR